MIPKVSRGSDMGGLVRYLVDTDRDRTRNVHQDPHLVAGSPEVMAWWGGKDLHLEDGRRIGREVDAARRVFRTEVSGGHVWHTSLSLRADEGQLSDEKWGEIAREFVAGMGFDDPESPESPCSWVAVRHGLSAAGNDHIHLAVSLARADGSAADVFRDYKRAQTLARELEVRHGLVRVAQGGRATRGVSRAELQRQARVGAHEPERRTLARVVRGAAAQASSEADFVQLVRGAGVRALPWFARGGRGEVAGYRVAGRPERGKQTIWFGGGKLAPDLSLPRLRAAHGWSADPGAAVAATMVWQQAEQTPAPRRPPVVVPEQVWRARAGEIAQLRDWLTTLPVGDPRWAAGAGELAGVFAAWAGSVERGKPGPLSAAADRLANVAGVRARVAPARPVEMPSGRGAARVVASAARGGRGSVAEIALLAQLRDTAAAMVGAGQAERLARQAAQAAEEARARLVAAGVGPQRGSGVEPRRIQAPGRSGRGWGRGS